MIDFFCWGKDAFGGPGFFIGVCGRYIAIAVDRTLTRSKEGIQVGCLAFSWWSE